MLLDAGDFIALVQLDFHLGAVALADVRLVDPATVGLDAQDGPGDPGQRGGFDLRRRLAGQRRLPAAGTAATGTTGTAATAEPDTGLLERAIDVGGAELQGLGDGGVLRVLARLVLGSVRRLELVDGGLDLRLVEFQARGERRYQPALIRRTGRSRAGGRRGRTTATSSGQASCLSRRQPPARLFAMICLNIARSAVALSVSPS